MPEGNLYFVVKGFKGCESIPIFDYYRELKTPGIKTGVFQTRFPSGGRLGAGL